MKRIIVLLWMCLLISACAKDEPALVKKDTPPIDPNTTPELIKQTNDKEDVDEFIEFPLNDEIIMVNLSRVPILQQYLQVASDRDKKIEEMTIERVHQKDENSVYLLEFSCNNTYCSYLLLDQNKENTGHLVADLATITQTKLSNDGSKLLLFFKRDSSLPLPLANIVVMDLEEWKPIQLINLDENDVDVLNYRWPILSVDWLDNETISVSIPNIVEPTKEMIDGWQGDLKLTTTILLKTQLE
ncbi:hypothetical protein ACFSTA_05125 [Ornithinibacillus salinisoli]|uniref:Lipoprotein n=1 Tax=Ornithinibacillus salinisoli TaxID=1848459 RepID=A0ABW4VYS2_9BACI